MPPLQSAFFTAERKLLFKPFIISLLIVLGLSWLSALPIAYNFDWYETLQKPWFNPDRWVFNLVWPILYIMLTLSAWLVWRQKSHQQEAVEEALGLFVLQLVANYLWPLFFFGMQSPWLGLLWIMLVWVLVFLNIVFFYGLSRTAAWLLLPYGSWISFASYLNYWLWRLNGA